MFVSSSAAQFLVNGLELVSLAEGDELHDLVRQPHLRGGSGFYGIARIPITADKNFFICHLPDTDVQFTLLRKNHGRAGKAVGADGRDNDAFGLRIKDRPACRQRISGGAGGCCHNDTIAPVMLHQDIVTIDAEIHRLLHEIVADMLRGGEELTLNTKPSIILVIGLYIGFAAMKSPESPMVFWSSLIPFTSPIVMLVRIPFGVPTWEILTSMALLIVSFIFFTWLSGKIYRIGILMYGKKVTWKELYKWLKY